jgi:hypothetical protein
MNNSTRIKKILWGIIFSISIFTFACAGKKPEMVKVNYEPIDRARTDIDPAELKAHIEQIDEHHIGPTKRYTYHVIIFQRIDKAMFEEIAMYMYEKAQAETPFNALSVVFYDYPQFIGMGSRLGYVNFAPDGVWGKANTVKTGDYSSMLMEDRLIEPQWEYALTVREAEILGDFFKLSDELSENADTGDELSVAEETAIQAVVQKYSITHEDFNDIFIKYLAIDDS